MAQLETLRARMPEVKNLLMQADGYAMWVVWQGELNPVLEQTIQDYGGIRICGDQGQSLWFFFSPDVFLAAARLGVWARFNQLSVNMQIFPAGARIGRSGERLLIFDDSLWKQNLEVSDGFSVWVYPSAASAATGIPGISLKKGQTKPDGMSAEEWALMEADNRLPYQSSLSWYVMMRPVGSPLDKAFQAGWREFFAQVEPLLQRNKFRFTVHDFFLIFPLESLRQFKDWVTDLLSLINRLKEEAPEKYWPCVQAIVDRKGLNFSNDLPQKINIDWEQLSPDFPHMILRNALLLGEGFNIHEVRLASEVSDQEKWTNVSIVCENKEESYASLPPILPAKLILGPNKHCFYCGQRSHEVTECPTRRMLEPASNIWQQVATLDFDVMAKASGDIDATLTAEGGLDKLLSDKEPAGIITRAIFSIDSVVQLRNVPTFWKVRNRDFNKAFIDLAPESDSPAWQLLRDFDTADKAELDKELQNMQLRFPKDYRIICLRGFAAIERGNAQQAAAFWKEAEMFSTLPVVQAWLSLLQGRAHEYEGRFPQAIQLYEHALRLTPLWPEPAYRRLVCTIKSGFADRAVTTLMPMIERDGHLFNKMLLDPEIERGSTQIMTALGFLWDETSERAKKETSSLRQMHGSLGAWFMPDHPFAQETAHRIEKLLQLSDIKNFVAFQAIIRGYALLDREIQSYVKKEAVDFKSRFMHFMDRLRQIHEEAAWFPFPKALVDFNRSYNQSVANLNWALKANFQSPDAFKKAQILVEQETTQLKKLESRLKFLRVVRDSTLFLLSMFEAFFWIEIVCTLIIFVFLPLILVYGPKIGLDWTSTAIAKQSWQVQKAIFFLVSVLAFAIAALRTVLRFEYIRNKTFAKARAKLAAKTPPAKASPASQVSGKTSDKKA